MLPRLNPFENQVYFHMPADAQYMGAQYLMVLIPLRIRSISTPRRRPSMSRKTDLRLNPFENQVYFHDAVRSQRSKRKSGVLIPLRIRSISTRVPCIRQRQGLPSCLNPFENQVYFHSCDCVCIRTCSRSVLIPLRIRSISTRSL